MDPAQSSTGLVMEIKHETGVEFDVQGGNKDYLEMEDNLELGCPSNCEGIMFSPESHFGHYKVEETEDLELDILECADNVYETVHGDDPDATEHSSSFGNTFSFSDDSLKLNNSSDAEAESHFPGDAGASAVSDGFNRIFGKKRLSVHWRRFIRPLTWRCRWIELRMKELHSQALKYDQELSMCNEEKKIHAKMVASDKSVARSVPMTCQSRRKQVMRRRKRTRIEDTVDISSYMSRHSILSYYDGRPGADGLSLDGDDCGDQDEQNIKSHDVFGSNSEWLMLDFREADDYLERILLDIDGVQARVLELKSQLKKEICENGGEFSSTLDMFVARAPHYSSALSPRCSPSNGKDAMPAGLLGTPPGYISEYEIEDLVMPGSAVSSYGDAVQPDIIESTVDLLSSAFDVSLNQHQIGEFANDSSYDILINNQAAYDILINNQAAEDDLQDFEKVSLHIERTPNAVKEEEQSTPPRASGSETGSETEIITMPERSALKSCSKSDIHVRRSKRKKIERRRSPDWNGGKVRKRRSSKEKENSSS